MSTSDPKIPAADLESLIVLFQQSGWDELHLELDGLELFLSNDPQAALPHAGPPAGAPVAAGSVATAGAATPAPADTAAADAVPEGWAVIRAPNLGTFYRAPKPGAAPYVDVGQRVTPDTEVCLIEVMKLFAPVRAGVAGVVREVRAADGQMVEFDTPLFVIEPE